VMSEMLEVVIDSIRVSLMSQQRIVILKEKDSERYLPIWIGVNEAESITIALQEVEVARPLTHDLIKNIFKEFNARLLRIEVIALRDDTYYGNIVAEVDSKIVNIDSRPSDAIAIAVRTHIPILVARSVLDVAGIIPEEDLQSPQQEINKPASMLSEPSDEDAEDRLSIFEDFLDKLDLNNIDSDQSSDKPED
jgi:uncharacterized protein